MSNPNGSNWIRKAKRLRIHERDSWKCVWCCTDVGPGQCGFATLDHVLPRECGGSNDVHNLITACLGCNSARGKLSVLQFARKLWSEKADQHFWSHVCEVLNRVVRATSALPPLRKVQQAA